MFIHSLYSKGKNIPVETFRTLEKLIGHVDLKQTASHQMHALIRAGDAKLSAYLIKGLWE